MTRTMDSATQTALTERVIYGAWFVRLNFVGDPVFIHTGMGNIYFASGMGYDPALVGETFIGYGNIFSIDTITDAQDGSQGLNLTLPGVQLDDDYLHQIINNADLWQGQQAYLWFATFDDNGSMIGKPIRVKTARMDQMPISIDPDNNTGTLVVTLESQGSYNGEANQHRYNQQRQIDSNDTSQDYVYALANMVATIGSSNTAAQTKAAAASIQAGKTPVYF